MKTTYKIILAALAGYIVARYLMQKKASPAMPAAQSVKTTIKKGDLSKEVEELQRLINRLFGTDVVDVSGAYDKKTSEVVQIIFYDTKELANVELGEVSIEAIRLLNKVLDNIQTKSDE